MKASFSRPGKFFDSKRNHSMGAASSTFKDTELDFNVTIAIKLSCYIFGRLDRQAIAGLERSQNISAPHRQCVRRLVAQTSEQNPSLKDILKPLLVQKNHNLAYSVFNNVCVMTANSQRYDMSFLKKVIFVGKAMGLSEDEILRQIEKTGLAA